MPLYFFHLRNAEDRVIDDEGRRIDDVSMVPELAQREARGIISADALTGHIDLDQRIEVEDENGLILLTLPLAHAVQINAPGDSPRQA
jgi:hypothetical protein